MVWALAEHDVIESVALALGVKVHLADEFGLVAVVSQDLWECRRRVKIDGLLIADHPMRARVQSGVEVRLAGMHTGQVE